MKVNLCKFTDSSGYPWNTDNPSPNFNAAITFTRCPKINNKGFGNIGNIFNDLSKLPDKKQLKDQLKLRPRSEQFIKSPREDIPHH